MIGRLSQLRQTVLEELLDTRYTQVATYPDFQAFVDSQGVGRDDRLVPDIMRAAAQGEAAVIRNPRATRPWQHVLEPLSGYLLLAQELFAGNRDAASAWNFGPDGNGIIDVAAAAAELQKAWQDIRFEINPPAAAPHEAVLLHLDCRKAHEKLQWRGIFTPEEMFGFTARWYQEFYCRDRVITGEQLDKYTALAAARGARWAE